MTWKYCMLCPVEFKCMFVRSYIAVYCKWWGVLMLVIIICEKSVCLLVKSYVK